MAASRAKGATSASGFTPRPPPATSLLDGLQSDFLADRVGPGLGALRAAALGPALQHDVVERRLARLDIGVAGLHAHHLAGLALAAGALAGHADQAHLDLVAD